MKVAPPPLPTTPAAWPGGPRHHQLLARGPTQVSPRSAILASAMLGYPNGSIFDLGACALQLPLPLLRNLCLCSSAPRIPPPASLPHSSTATTDSKSGGKKKQTDFSQLVDQQSYETASHLGSKVQNKSSRFHKQKNYSCVHMKGKGIMGLPFLP